MPESEISKIKTKLHNTCEKYCNIYATAKIHKLPLNGDVDDIPLQLIVPLRN